MINSELRGYCEEHILPQYDHYDKGHGRAHIDEVVTGAAQLARRYDVDCDMIYAAAIFHDLGLVEGRELHHMTSGRMAREDRFLISFFSASQLETIAQAIEDHRASNPNPPRTIYGEIISSADRRVDIDTIIMRAYYYRSSHLEELGLATIIDEIHRHISAKYGESGYVKIPILTISNGRNLSRLRTLLGDVETFKAYCAEVIARNVELANVEL
ncbi:MAG: HD domain-containing protein [Rikenellaceae bacterium]